MNKDADTVPTIVPTIAARSEAWRAICQADQPGETADGRDPADAVGTAPATRRGSGRFAFRN
jgi:hypothetical protein